MGTNEKRVTDELIDGKCELGAEPWAMTFERLKNMDYDHIEEHGVKIVSENGDAVGKLDVATNTLIIQNGGLWIEESDIVMHDKEICRDGLEKGG